MEQKAKDHYWLKSGFLLLLQNFSSVFFAFGSFYLLIRLLTKYDFGVWTLYMSTITIIEIVRNGLIQNALIKFLSPADADERPKIISASFVISGGLTIFCIILNLLFAGWLSRIWDAPEILDMLYLYNINFLITGILMQFNCVEQAGLKFKGVFAGSLLRQGGFFFYVLVCFILNFKINLISLVYVQLLIAVISTIAGYFYARPYFSISFKIYPEWIKKLFDYGKYAFGTSVSSMLSGTIDQMMLGAILSPAASGSFNIAVRITNLIDIPINAMAQLVFPQSAKRIETDGKDAVKYLYERSVGVILALLIPAVIFLYLFSDWAIHFIAGEKYADTIPLLKITLLYCFFLPYGRQFGTILDSIGKARINFFVVLFMACTNIGLNYFFITELGVMGAAYATLCTNIVGFIIAQSILRKELQVNPLNAFIYAYRFYPDFFRKYIKRKQSGGSELI